MGRGPGGSSAASTEDMAKGRALVRELGDPAAVLTIIAAANHVTITNDRGAVRKFTPDSTSQEIDLGTDKVTAKAKWDLDTFVVEWTAGKTKFTESYQVTVQGHMLVVRIAPVVSGSVQADPSSAPVKYIFDRVESEHDSVRATR